MRNLGIILLGMIFILAACGGSDNANNASEAQGPPSYTQEEEKAPVSDKGIGEITHVELNNPLNPEMIERGTAIYEMKCAACHKLSDQRVVGPGWAGITDRRKPEWIMNMATNVEVMLAEDPAAQEMLKECLVRMPNQNLSVADARDVLEMMYENDAGE